MALNAKKESSRREPGSPPLMKPEAPSGPVIVSLEDEDVELGSNEWSLLARGPKYCLVRGCSEEDMRVEIETCVLKHKRDCMGREGDEDEELLSEEAKLEHERVAQLAEEMAAQTRMVHNTDEDSWDAREHCPKLRWLRAGKTRLPRKRA